MGDWKLIDGKTLYHLGNDLTSVSDATNALTNSAVFNLGTSDPWALVISNQALGQAPNNDTYTGESFDLTGQTARFVAIRVDSS